MSGDAAAWARLFAEAKAARAEVFGGAIGRAKLHAATEAAAARRAADDCAVAESFGDRRECWRAHAASARSRTDYAAARVARLIEEWGGYDVLG